TTSGAARRSRRGGPDAPAARGGGAGARVLVAVVELVQLGKQALAAGSHRGVGRDAGRAAGDGGFLAKVPRAAAHGATASPHAHPRARGSLDVGIERGVLVLARGGRRAVERVVVAGVM